MKTLKNWKIKLFAAFALLFLVKALTALYANNPFMFIEENCTAVKALAIINLQKITGCNEIYTKFTVEDTYDFYSILLSPFYYITTKLNAYKLGLILNALLTSTLLYPIFKLINTHLKNINKSILYSLLILLLPAFIALEKTLTPFALFITISIWIFYFYHTNKLKTALLLSIISTFIINFGILNVLTLTISEIYNNKNKKHIALFLIPISVILVTIQIKFLSTDTLTSLNLFIENIEYQQNFLSLLITSILGSINSLTIASLVIGLILGTYFLKTKELSKYKNYIYIITILHLIFGAYILYSNENIRLYTNLFVLPGIFFTLITIIGINLKTSLNLKKIALISLILLPLLFINKKFHTPYNILILNDYPIPYLIMLAISSLIIIALRQKLKPLLIIFLLVSSILISHQTLNLTIKNNETFNFFHNNKEEKILFLSDRNADKPIPDIYWLFNTISEDQTEISLMEIPITTENQVSLSKEFRESVKKEGYTHIISTHNLSDLKEIFTTKDQYIYEI